MSAKGISLFINGSPKEFTYLSEWLIEREAFVQLKGISFFQRFRIWNAVRMWRRNVSHLRREKKRKILEDKLFLVDKNYDKCLLNHR